MTVSSASESRLDPEESVTLAPLKVAEPLAPVLDAVHVLLIVAAVSCSCPERFTLAADAELVTVPPGVPWVLASNRSELNRMAGPNDASPVGADAVTGDADPAAGRLTVGVGPRVAAGPPNRLTVTKKP